MAVKKKNKSEKNKTELIKELSDELLKLMGANVEAEVFEDQENEALIINIDAKEETGLLIGRHGETLLSLQTVLAIMAHQRLGEWVRLVVNVGDYRQKEEERLKALAFAAAQRAKETGQPQPLYNLSPSQRRIVHLALSEELGLETESLGEGPERYLVIRTKTQ